MKRILTVIPVLAWAGAALAGVALAPAAHAVTNPADNPHPITVKGDDGNTYTDGQDTLPGYDDEACTYIPGAWFDFDSNKVHYADGQSIPWTEWERATGYKEWQAKHAGGGTTTPSKPRPSSSPSTRPSTGDTKPSGAGTKSSAKPGSAGATDAATDPATTTGTTGTTGAATPGAAAAKPGAPTTSTTPAIGDLAQADASDAEVIEPTAARTEHGSSSSAGLVILGGLGALGLAAVGGYTALGRRRKERA
ncbi:MAG: hypothetical protein J7518_19535 [Nocardioidaceae bacterium]|nr:hypothetical protein [Nocardioidaceae bacterium]